MSNIFHLLAKGFEAWNKALQWKYPHSEEIDRMRQELFNDNKSDAAKLREDRNRIYHDIRTSYNNLSLTNG